jgi:hypothetical protein
MKLLTVFLFLLAFSSNIFAKPSGVEWKELIEYSEVIALVELKSVQRLEQSNGYTEVNIVQLLKGKTDSEKIGIHWKLTTDSIPISEIFNDYIVFLRLRNDGSYEPSFIAQSVWRLENVSYKDKNRNYVDLELILSTIRSVPQEIYSLVEVQSCNSYNGPREVKRVRLADIANYFKEKRYLSL